MQNNTFSTLFVGQNLINLASVDSTNSYLKNLLSKSEPLPEGTVILAEDQYQGRGQMGNVWYAEPGKNLTFSVLLYPSFLPLNQQFLLNMAVSNAVRKALKNTLAVDAQVKWPNDIYVGDEKLGGILIENTLSGQRIKQSIVGIGINVNQRQFLQVTDRKVTSLHRILQSETDKTALLADICVQLETQYLLLRQAAFETLRYEYTCHLYRHQQLANYSANGQLFEGMITGVADDGVLKMVIGKEERTFNLKEIEFINI